MTCPPRGTVLHNVALRKESVDRNNIVSVSSRVFTTSLSARRAWIEMFLSMGLDGRFKVALRKESVDRNKRSISRIKVRVSRSPQGERG